MWDKTKTNKLHQHASESSDWAKMKIILDSELPLQHSSAVDYWAYALVFIVGITAGLLANSFWSYTVDSKAFHIEKEAIPIAASNERSNTIELLSTTELEYLEPLVEDSKTNEPLKMVLRQHSAASDHSPSGEFNGFRKELLSAGYTETTPVFSTPESSFKSHLNEVDSNRSLSKESDMLVGYTDQENFPEETAILSDVKNHLKTGIEVGASKGIGEEAVASISGGVNVMIPLAKDFTIEPGIGYTYALRRTDQLDLLESAETLPTSESSIYSRAEQVGMPDLSEASTEEESEHAYQNRQYIEIPVSVHYSPIKRIAFTTGFNANFLVNKPRLLSSIIDFEPSINTTDTDEALQDLNRFKLNAFGGVSWFPTNNWKVGLYYNQSIQFRATSLEGGQTERNNLGHLLRLRVGRYF